MVGLRCSEKSGVLALVSCPADVNHLALFQMFCTPHVGQTEAPEIRCFVLLEALYRQPEKLFSWFGGERAEECVFIQP